MSKNLCWGEGRSRGWRWHRAAVAACHRHAELVQRGLSCKLLPDPCRAPVELSPSLRSFPPSPPSPEREHQAVHQLSAALLPTADLPSLCFCLPHHTVASWDLASVFTLACTSASSVLEAAGRGRHIPEDDEHY